MGYAEIISSEMITKIFILRTDEFFNFPLMHIANGIFFLYGFLNFYRSEYMEVI